MLVSIPFKRESISELHRINRIGLCHARVSIPFKRESISEQRLISEMPAGDTFQFPSNGKAYLNNVERNVERDRNFVSIPFKRESISEQKPKASLKSSCWWVGFNSLQTGKHI